jgi:hypothetical protein
VLLGVRIMGSFLPPRQRHVLGANPMSLASEEANPEIPFRTVLCTCRTAEVSILSMAPKPIVLFCMPNRTKYVLLVSVMIWFHLWVHSSWHSSVSGLLLPVGGRHCSTALRLELKPRAHHHPWLQGTDI